MVSVEERMKVLNLLQDGAITPEQAAQLLQAMESNRPAPAASYAPAASEAPASVESNAWDDAPAAPFAPVTPAVSSASAVSEAPAVSEASAVPSWVNAPPPTSGQRAHWLHVRVSDMQTGRPRVNVRLPLSLVGFGLKMGRHFAPEMEGMDIDGLAQVLQMGEPGPYVDVYDEDDGEHVEVFLE